MEEIAAEIDGRRRTGRSRGGLLRGRLLRHVRQIERGDFEQIASAFAIAGRDDWRVDVDEALLLEKIVNRAADLIP